MDVEIRKATIEDVNSLQQIGRKTFTEAFSMSNSEENMRKYLEEGFSRENLIKELSNATSQFYFAQLNGQVIGYLKLNAGQSQTELKDDKALEIERIYVLADYQGKKVGQLLYEKAMQVANELGSSYVWLGVWEENLKAIQFYKKNGFVTFNTHIFMLGEDEQTDIMMKKMLSDPDISNELVAT